MSRGKETIYELLICQKCWSVYRYNILAAAVVANAKNDKSAAKSLFELVGLEAEKYRLGHTKASNHHSFDLVCFKALDYVVHNLCCIYTCTIFSILHLNIIKLFIL